MKENILEKIKDSIGDYIKKIVYKIRYGRKFKKLNIGENLCDILIDRSKNSNEKDIFQLIRRSKNQEEFSNNVIDYLKKNERNIYASSLLIGNVTGKYIYNGFWYSSVKEINIDAFNKANQDLIQELKSHFVEYLMDNNNRKNDFAERMEVNNFQIRDLSQDIKEEELLKDFERVLNGEETNDSYKKPQAVAKYIMKTIGIYSREDIKNNFDFILYDIDKDHKNSVDDRRKQYLSHCNLSNNQLQKVNDLSLLKRRLQEMNIEESKELLSRISKIESNMYENISELEDIYSDYEILYRQDLLNHLYVPKDNVTIIENYKDMEPQLIHLFLRNPEKFRDLEIDKIKNKIIMERLNKNNSEELTEEENEKVTKLLNKVEAQLDQYKVNFSTDGKGTSYSDSSGLEWYYSDTSNQISASVFNGMEFVNASNTGIIGIGFNKETLSAEAIAISSNCYKTTNKGLNNIEYNENLEFDEMSSPFSELINSRGKSEVVMHRRGMDFDTKASYIFAIIDSSDLKKTNEIFLEIEQIREKEGLKVVVFDRYKIKESLEKQKEEQYENKEVNQMHH